MDHWANLLIRRSISSKSAKKTMLKRSNNLSKKEAFWQEKESPILIIAHPNWIYLRSGSKNTFITTSPAKLSTWTEQISRTFLKASKSSTTTVPTWAASNKSFLKNQKVNPNSFHTCQTKQPDSSTLAKTIAAMLCLTPP